MRTGRWPQCLVVLAAAVASGVSTSTACEICYWEGDAKTMPGSACAVREGSDPTKAWVDFRGGICNNDNNVALKVTCPIVRDVTTNTDGLHCAQANFYWDAYKSRAECTLYARQASGFGNYYGTTVLGPAATGPTSIGMHINNSYDKGYYHLTCLIPPEANDNSYSCLRSFAWAE